MARAMIACPNTGKPIYTGMSFDKITFETSQLPNRSVLCPECGLTVIVSPLAHPTGVGGCEMGAGHRL